MIRRPPRSTQSRSSAASDVYKRQVSGFSIEEIEPRLFSFNAPQGACSECDGLGVEKYFDENKIVPDETRSISDGAIKPWETKVFGYQKNILLKQ